MALANTSVGRSNGMPSAPFRVETLKADLDAAYPAGGYDVSALIEGSVVGSFTNLISDGTNGRFAKITEAVAGTRLLQVFLATGVEVAGGVDLSAFTGVSVDVLTE